MRSHCAVYVDVGYLVASAATRTTGSSLRAGVVVDHARLLRGIVDQVTRESSLPLLRVNWYDSGTRPGGVADAQQERIGLLPRVKLRLGRLSHAGDQKGVDLRIGLDLVGHAQNGAVEVVYLLSGDDDLSEAVEMAQERGVQVVVLAVPDRDGKPHAVSRHLQRAADDVVVIDPQLMDATVLQAQSAAEPVQMAEAAQTSPAPALAGSAMPAPSPALLAHRRALPPPSPEPARAQAVFSTSTGDPAVGEEPPCDDQELIDQVCRTVLASWQKSATPSDRSELELDRPNVPNEIDRALLLDLSSRSGIYYLEQQTRFLLRERFWAAVDAADGSV